MNEDAAPSNSPLDPKIWAGLTLRPLRLDSCCAGAGAAAGGLRRWRADGAAAGVVAAALRFGTAGLRFGAAGLGAAAGAACGATGMATMGARGRTAAAALATAFAEAIEDCTVDWSCTGATGRFAISSGIDCATGCGGG